MHHLRPALALIVLFTALTGLALPLGFSVAATALAPGLAGGSILERDGVPVGSALIGQLFASDRYVHPRPSATSDTDPADATKSVPSPYNASNSAGSNLGPTSRILIDRVHAAAAGHDPADAVTTSASGLDPDISPANAARQADRVALARNIPPDRVRALIAAHTQGRTLGLFGEPRVNVLTLNIALDRAEQQ